MKLSKITLALFATLTLVGVAHAGDPAMSKKKAPDAAKPKPPADQPKEQPPQAMPEKPTVAPELAAAAKASKGTWKCKAEMFDPSGKSYQTKFTAKVKADLDNLWIRTEMTEAKSKFTKYPFKFTSYKTYDPQAKKWNQIMVDNWGGVSKGWSTGPDATGKTVWEMDMTMMGQTVKFRDHEEPGEKKGTQRWWGEMSMDGKNWTKAYDAVCKK